MRKKTKGNITSLTFIGKFTKRLTESQQIRLIIEQKTAEKKERKIFKIAKTF